MPNGADAPPTVASRGSSSARRAIEARVLSPKFVDGSAAPPGLLYANLRDSTLVGGLRLRPLGGLHPEHLDLEDERLAGQRMVQVEDHGLLLDLLHRDR